MCKRILVPVDGSSTSDRGLGQAIGLAAALKARLVVLHVVNDLALQLDSAAMEDTQVAHDATMQAAEDLVATAAAAAAAQGVDCDRVVLDARTEATADAICREAASRDCDMIVMGTHGWQGLKRLTLGSDAERVLRQASVPVLLIKHAESPAEVPRPKAASMADLITILIGPEGLEGELCVREPARGLVIFAHGSGSSRHSRRNQLVAGSLQARGFSTLLFDLLAPSEADDRSNVFDIELLAQRLLDAIDALPAQVHEQPLGLFGASTGAAAALVAAASRPRTIQAVVSRGGRPDLAGEHLAFVQAPTLLIVGGADTEVLELNRAAYVQLQCQKRIEIVPRATHLFEEAGALEAVAGLAGEWFLAHLRRPG